MSQKLGKSKNKKVTIYRSNQIYWNFTSNSSAENEKKWDEFTHLYQTLFSNADVYIQIVEALATKQSGLTRADYYTLFYFRFLKNQYGKDEHFWTHTLDNPKRRAWAGYAFEQICKDHISQIKKRIGISAVLNEQASWRSKESEPGTQIDLLIARRDRVINICEIKFSLSSYVIDKDYDVRLRNKLEVFRQETGIKDALHLTFVTTYGVKPNMYSGLVQSEVVMDDLFMEWH